MADYVSRERTMPVRFTDLEQKWNEQKRKTAYELKLAQGFAVADMYLTQQYLDRFSAGTVYEPDNTVMDVLKMRVCSPAGTTIEGVLALEQGGFSYTVQNAVTAAYRRTVEMTRKG